MSKLRDKKLEIALNRQVGVLPKLYEAVLFYSLWGTRDLHEAAFVKCQEREQLNRLRCRHKIFSTPTFLG
jgi:hypothetical protein